MLHWIDCDIVYLCSYGSSSCCIGLRYCLPVFLWFFLMLPWIDCDIVFSVFSWFFVMLLLIYSDIVYLCSHGSSSFCIGLIVTLFISVLMVLSHVSLD